MNEDSLVRSTQYQDAGAVFAGYFRLGFVTDVNNEKRLSRVKFEDLGYTSDWLPVLISRDFIPDYDVPQETEARAGGAGYPQFESHTHPLVIKPYMPKIGEQVLCIYEPVRGGRGFILGGIRPWR